jgi:zinc protease
MAAQPFGDYHIQMRNLAATIPITSSHGAFSMHGLDLPRRIKISGGLVLFAILFSPLGACADGPAEAKKVTSVEGITEYRLDNGLKILLFPDPSASRVTVNCTVLVGSRHEGYGETGMAHLLEHMVFKGTPTHADVPKALRDHGAQFNGSTSDDRTNYFETMDATDENLEFAIRMEADRLVNSYIKREDLASEMTVVRNEFEMGENMPEAILFQRMMAVAYEWHNYGKSTIGNRSDIERVPIENLQAFYKKYYRPDNVVLVVAGKFDEKKALGYIGKYFGALKKQDRKLDQTYTEEPPQDGERSVILRRVGTVGAVGAVYHIPAGAHPDFGALEVLERVLVSEPAGRLYKALVESKKASSLRGFASPSHDPGILAVIAQVDRGQPVEEIRDAMLDVLEKLPANKVTADEVSRAKTKLLRDRELRLTKSNSIGTELSEWASMGDWRLLFLHRDRVSKVTADEVNRVAAKYLIRTNRTVGMFVPSEKPDRAAIPETPNIDNLLKDYKGGKELASGEAFDPTPENIEARVRRSELPGGIKVALLPKKSRGETAVVRLSLRYGNEESLGGLVDAAQLLPELMARGTKNHTYQQLQDELDKLKARFTAQGPQPGLMAFSIECKRENIPAVVKLLGEVLREPTLPEKELDHLKRRMVERVRQGQKDPQMLAITSLQRRLSPYTKEDIRYVPTIEESIQRAEAVTIDQVRKLYADQIGAQHGELTVVGDFDGDSLVKQVGDIVKDWTTKTPYRRIPRPADTEVAGGKDMIDTPDKANAVYLAGLTLPLKDSDPDNPALEVGNFILGGAPLSSRLSNRVRGKDGLSYGCMSMYNASPIDPAANYMCFAICNPINMAKVNAAIAEETEKILKAGVTAEELEQAKAAYLKQLKGQRSTDQALSLALANGLFVGRTFSFNAEQETKIAGLTVDAVNSALRRHLNPKRLVIIEAGDFKKKGGDAQQ